MPFIHRIRPLAVAALTALAVFGSAPAQAAEPRAVSDPKDLITIPAEWTVGEKVYYRVTRGQSKKGNPKTDRETSVTALMSAEIVEGDDGRVVHRWRLEDFEPTPERADKSSPSQQTPEGLKAILNVEDQGVQVLMRSLLTMPVDMEVDEDGTITDVTNLPLIRERVTEFYEKAIQPASGTPPEVATGVRALLDRILLSDAVLTGLLTESQVGIYETAGGQYAPEHLVETTMMQPLPMVNAQLPMPLKVSTGKLGKDRSLVITTLADMPADKLVPLVIKMARETFLVGMDDTKRLRFAEMMRRMKFSMRYERTSVLEDGSAWPREVNSTRRIEASSPEDGSHSIQIQTVRMRRVVAPAGAATPGSDAASAPASVERR